MASLSQWSNYDYNGAIFVFGRIDKTLTAKWNEITLVKMSVDSSSNYLYSTAIKSIPYTQDNTNNTQCKVFNINTFQHRISDTSKYQYSSGSHTCYLAFYSKTGSSESLIASTSVIIYVHASLSTPTISLDENNGIINVSRSYTYNSPRYYIEIRRKDRNKINPNISWQDKDYIHTVIMKGIEGGKYNEGIPHTAFMTRGEASIAGSTHNSSNNTSIINPMCVENKVVDSDKNDLYYNLNNSISLMSTSSSSPTTVYINTDIPYTSTNGVSEQYFKFTSPSAGMYHFYQKNIDEKIDLRCTLYSDSNYENYLASDDDSGTNYAFDLYYVMKGSETVFIKIYDYSKNGLSTNLRIEKANIDTTFNSFTTYTMAANSKQTGSFYASKAGYITLYPAKRKPGKLRINGIDTWNCLDCKTPYYVIQVNSGTNYFFIENQDSAETKFLFTNVHSDVDFQPYWRVNAISSFKACVVFDDSTIQSQHEDICMAQVNDALTRLSNIISETSGNQINFEITNLGVSKLYVKETIEATKYSSTIYYAPVTKGTIYRVSYNHAKLYYGTSYSSLGSAISGTSSYIWYEDVGYNVGIDENTLVVGDNTSGYYVKSSEAFTLEAVSESSECSSNYNSEYSGTYNMTIRFGLDGTTWMGNQGIATSGQIKNGGTSADYNGQGQWINWLYYNSSLGVSWSYAIINVDTSDIFESLYHVIHEEMAQSLGIGDDCYSHEESIHWDPEYANPDYYTGIDKTILDFAYKSNKNGYTQFDLCNEYDLPITLFREYSEYNSSTRSFQFRLKDANGDWLLRSGEYDIYAWCTTPGSNGGSIGGSSYSDGWDDDPYSFRSSPITLTVEGGWYWSDYNIDMKKGLKVTDVPYTVWNSFCDAVAEVMGTGTMPSNSETYGTASGQSFSVAIEKAKATENDKTLYAQRFNIVNYIINQKVTTNIDIQYSLTSQVLAEYLIKLQDCRNLM